MRNSDSDPDRRDRNLIIRIDERVGMLIDDMTQVKQNVAHLDCKVHDQRIRQLENYISHEKDKKYDARLTAIERLFWPVVASVISSFIGIMFTIFKLIG